MKNERRNTNEGFELRDAESGEGLTAVGYAAVFDQPISIGGFTESVGRSAFDKTLQESDVLGLFNHEVGQLLGRSSAGTLRLSKDDRGLAYELDLPDTTLGRDVAVLLQRGDLKGSSFGFRTIKDSWSGTHRSLREVALRDVGPVTMPAYPDSSVALRSLAQDHNIDIDELAAAAAAGELEERIGNDSSSDGGAGEAEAEPLTIVRRRFYR